MLRRLLFQQHQQLSPSNILHSSILSSYFPQFGGKRSYTKNEEGDDDDTSDDDPLKAKRMAAREKKLEEMISNWNNAIEEAAKIKIEFTPEELKEHARIGRTYHRELNKQTSHFNYDLNNKIYLKQEAIKALPTELQADARKVKSLNFWRDPLSKMILEDLRPVWETPPVKNPEVVIESLNDEQKRHLQKREAGEGNKFLELDDLPTPQQWWIDEERENRKRRKKKGGSRPVGEDQEKK